MNDLQKYKEVIIYLGIVIVLLFVAYKQIQPKFVETLDTYSQVKSQTEVDKSTADQLATAKEKAERKKKLRMLDDMTKKIYQQDDGSIDPDTTFAFLMDDTIDILRKNHIKTHSIQSTMNPEDDIFVKGDKSRFAACRLDMKIISDYTNFKKFLEDLYRYPYLININNVEIYPYQKDKKVLLINFSSTMYAARSDEEADRIEKERTAKEAETKDSDKNESSDSAKKATKNSDKNADEGANPSENAEDETN